MTLAALGPAFEPLSTLLERYMNEIAARVVLRSAAEFARADFETATSEDVRRVAAKTMPFARALVEATRREALRAQLLAFAAGQASASSKPTTSPLPPPVAFVIRSEQDASAAQLAARALCEDLGARGFDTQKVATAVSELALNQLIYAGGGKIEITAALSPVKKVRIDATDAGPGIGNLSEILSGQYRSQTGRGLGLLGLKRMATVFNVKTGHTGTEVVFEVQL